MKVLSVFGTRPEATKMIPLIKVLEATDEVESQVCVTAQHREMLDSVLEMFGVVPDFDLNVMTAGQTLTEVTTRVLTGLEPILKQARPDILLVHGDTATTTAASLAAFYAKIAVGHVEAGLRSFDKYQPYPEEINRKITTAVADLHFAPTKLSRDNLLKENIPAKSIFVTGNTAIDMLAYTTSDTEYVFKNPLLAQKLKSTANFNAKKTPRVILLTAHRGENKGQPMEDICHAVARISQEFSDTLFVLPLHPNGAIAEPARQIFAENPQVLLTEPLDIFDTHNLMKLAGLSHGLVVTDSGGLQEEAPSFNVPVLVLRNVTERPEGIDAGTLRLVGTDKNVVFDTASLLLNNAQEYKRMAEATNPYGDGLASQRIVEAILEYFL